MDRRLAYDGFSLEGATVIVLLSGAVIASTVVGAVVGILWPGPLTGLILPVSLTAWWLLYRIIKAYRSPVANPCS